MAADRAPPSGQRTGYRAFAARRPERRDGGLAIWRAQGPPPVSRAFRRTAAFYAIGM